MKNYTLFALLAVSALALFLGCRDNQRSGNVVLTTPRVETAAEATAEATAKPTAGAATEAVAGAGERGQLRTGLGVITTLSSSRPASGESNGQAQIDSTLVAITVNEQGVITRASFDAAQTRIAFNAQGQIVTDLFAQVRTKNELGDAYNMRRVSGIGKEYNEQLAALEAWAIGRTPTEFMAMALNDGRAVTADLTASVTVNISSYLTAMNRAVSNLRTGDATRGHRTGLGVVTDISASRSATADQAGRARVTSYYAVLTLNNDNIIVSAWIDGSQADVDFDATGALVSSISYPVLTRFEMGDTYGMRRASAIGREWNEQMLDFARWMVGKTPAQVIGMRLNDGHPADADLTASVTINMISMLEAVARAAENAR